MGDTAQPRGKAQHRGELSGLEGGPPFTIHCASSVSFIGPADRHGVTETLTVLCHSLTF